MGRRALLLDRAARLPLADGKSMLNRFARALFTRLLTPLARLFLRAGVSPTS
jgi:CDP-diacylglycerol--glycerol-3-phosphate 3-phosphatidyltransferase